MGFHLNSSVRFNAFPAIKAFRHQRVEPEDRAATRRSISPDTTPKKIQPSFS
jgi:hypothetical protein